MVRTHIDQIGQVPLLFLAAALFVALCIGSFLNVCIWRLPRNISVSSPRRSFCPKCGTQLVWWENIPVLSWLILMGKCRTCSNAISIRYPLIEMLTLLIGFYSIYQFGFTINASFVFLLTSTLLVITAIDLDFKIIPNRITFPGMVVGLLMGIVAEYYRPFPFPFTQGALDSLIGFILGGGTFYLINWGYLLATGRSGLGGGDVKLMAMLGAIMGYGCLMTTVFVGSLAGSIIGLLIIVGTNKGRYYEIPFGPWLALGAVAHIFSLVTWFRI